MNMKVKMVCSVIFSVFLVVFMRSYPGFASSPVEDSNIYGDYYLSSSDKTISMDLKNADLVDVLKVLSRQTGLNFVSSEAVKDRKLTLYLDKVPLKDAMDTIFKANNLSYTFYPDSNIFIVKDMGKPGLELKTKVYHLKYAWVKDSMLDNEINGGLSDTSSGEINLDIGGGGGSGGSGGSSSGDEGILEAVKKVLSDKGTVTANVRTNALIVTDVPARFPLIEQVIKGIDVPLPKVLIEVEMLDVEKALVDKLGADWSGSGNGPSVSYFGPKRATAFPLHNLAGNNYASSFTMGSLDLAAFAAVLKFFTSDTSTRYLARPKILTLSNHTAQIEIATDEAIGVSSTTEGSTATTSVSIERTKTGTILRVTPQVNLSTNEITLFVEPKVIKAVESKISVTGMTSGNVKNPEERSMKGVIRLKDGQTLMLGGLLQDDNVNIKSGFPVLKDIPFLGTLFRYKSKTHDKRELLVFLTPHIIREGETLPQTSRIYSMHREQSLPLEKEYAVEKMLEALKYR